MTKETSSTVLHYRPTFTEEMENLNNTQPSSTNLMNSSSYSNSALPYFFQDRARMFDSSNDDDEEVKRPMNSFLLWAKIMRKKYAGENPNMHNAEISKLLGKIWNSMTPRDKRPFVEQAEKLRVLHMRTYPNYRYAPKRKKEKRSHRMISPEVAAALHSTLFDVKNIISEQLSQSKSIGQNLKSYGYLRNAFQQNNKTTTTYTENISSVNIDNYSNVGSVESSPSSFVQTHSPSSCSEYSITSPSAGEVSLVHLDSMGFSDPAICSAKTNESLTLHYYPDGQNIAALQNDGCTTQYHSPPNQSSRSPYVVSSSFDDSSGSEAEEEQNIGKEFSSYLQSVTIKNESGGNDDHFWSDIGDIIKEGSL